MNWLDTPMAPARMDAPVAAPVVGAEDVRSTTGWGPRLEPGPGQRPATPPHYLERPVQRAVEPQYDPERTRLSSVAGALRPDASSRFGAGLDYLHARSAQIQFDPLSDTDADAATSRRATPLDV